MSQPYQNKSPTNKPTEDSINITKEQAEEEKRKELLLRAEQKINPLQIEDIFGFDFSLQQQWQFRENKPKVRFTTMGTQYNGCDNQQKTNQFDRQLLEDWQGTQRKQTIQNNYS